MRCPKCHYISFDSGERCRNCGYDFSLAPDAKRDVPALDLAIQPPNPAVGPLADLELAERASVRPSGSADGESTSVSTKTPGEATDLPLFTDRPRPDAPRAAQPPVPKEPLSVRKSHPLPRSSRSRTEIDEPTLDLGVDGDDRTHDGPGIAAGGRVGLDAASLATGEAAGLAPRIFAGIVDTSIMVGVHGAVIYFTLRLCGLTFDEIASLPPVPMLGFLLLLTGGYFVCFTAAGGQTIGKMAAGIRVVPGADTEYGPSRVPLGTAVLRATGYLVSVLPAGAGLLPALFSPEHRALHDRLADTRVVKA
jgi:uncharacterized RDD family membrane protein YckC